MSPFQTRTAPTTAIHVDYRSPTTDDGIRLWEIASDSKVLDVNSSYSYVLWCHDFASTSIVAEVDSRTVGFVTGYRRPDDPAILMVWQVAVDDTYRGHRIAATMLHRLLDRTAHDGVIAMNTTISPDNVASQRLFESVATARGLRFTRRDLFPADAFPDAHQPEDLYLLEPVTDAN
ncbi:diaminobutyrate acetyltransferase [Gordonia sp. ABSL1-1]|uniref:diaminobutyrate acetyltransferase n=1 Tax=Gordonia sp. ABSL1-1 TaxID=3053923 RepID=UPI0025722703|nr:diaminobutyrate acetyltransferase [Gordonia sp. ABSL1-1]MDL9939007.1 diaminobutyrate acetyltransferase [Gordonia sp. ABSL1-1]